MASIMPVFLMIVIVANQFHHAESQFSVLATNQVQIIRLLEEITTTSTPLVPNITALLTNQETVLNEMNSAIHQIAAAQIQMAGTLDRIAGLLQSIHNNIPPTDCSDVTEIQNRGSGEYTINPRDGLGSFNVYCNMDTDDGGWTVFQKRFDGSVDFFLNWHDYENGFGNLYGEHWLGLQQMHRLTSSWRWTLQIDLEDFNGNIGYALYEDFKIGDAASFYQLSLGSFIGNITDSLSYHNGQAFSTKDRDHDENSGDCANGERGAWWYSSCHRSNLNAVYQVSFPVPDHETSVMSWHDFRGTNQWTPIKRSEMKIRKIQ